MLSSLRYKLLGQKGKHAVLRIATYFEAEGKEEEGVADAASWYIRIPPAVCGFLKSSLQFIP